jgi:hypothetical protein
LAGLGGVVGDGKLGADAIGIVRNAHFGIAGERLLPVGASSGRVAGNRAEVAEPFVRTCLRLRAGDLVGDAECRLPSVSRLPYRHITTYEIYTKLEGDRVPAQYIR